MKLATKLAIGILGSVALLAASQEPVRAAAADCVCCLMCALGCC
jgi:hypothetical protein